MTEDLLLDLPPGALSSGIPVPLVISPAAARLIAGAKTGGLMRSLSSARLVTSNKTKGLSLSLPASVMAVDVIGADAAPTVLISTEVAETVYTTFGITITFSEDVTGFVVGDITTTNATLSAFTAVSGTVYTVDVIPTYAGTVSVSVAAGVATGAGLNENSASNTLERDAVYLWSFEDGLGDWTNEGTWAYDASGAYDTPTGAADQITDGGLENWNSATDLTSWTEIIAGTSSVNQEDSVINGGAHAARLDLDASNSNAAIVQGLSNSANDWIEISFYARASASGKIIQGTLNNSVIGPNLALTTSYVQYLNVLRANANGTTTYIKRGALAGSSSLYIDDVTTRILSPVPLLREHPVPYGEFTMRYTRTPGRALALIINYSDANNYTMLYHTDGNSNKYLYLVKRVAGTWSSIGGPYAISYVDDGLLTLTRYVDGTMDIDYAGVSVATGLTASGLSGLYWGVLSLNAANRISEVSANSGGT